MDWYAIGAISGAIGAAGLIAGFVWKHVRPRLVAARQFWEHLVGVEANPITGQDKVQGLFERLDRQDAALEVIKHELFPNSGKSFRDDHSRLKVTVEGLAAELRNHLAKCPSEGDK